MKKRKLKTFVLPTVYVMVVMVVFGSMLFMNASLNTAVEETYEEESDYVIDVLDENELPVVSEVSSNPSKPYVTENIEIETDYYSMNDDDDTKEDSLIYYNSTYMQNTGILYKSDELFDVVASLDGVIKSISENDILGNVIEISHSNDYTTYYYSVTDILVSEGDSVLTGDVIAISGDNKISDDNENCLLFEVYYQGKTIDPNTFYEIDLNS